MVAVGTRIMVFPGQNAFGLLEPSIEEYHYANRSWTVLSKNLKLPRMSYAATSVPAVLFKNMPGGCQGIK